MISNCVEAVRPDLVVVDGIRDLVLDFNEPKECGRLLNDLMKLCTDYHCGMVTIIHSNKGDRNARGHLGTELMNKSETVVELKKNGNSVSVEPKCCRGLDFEPFSFTISEEGLPIISGDTPERKNEKKSVNDKEEIKQLFAQIMDADRTYSHQELQKEVSEKIKQSSKTAGRRIKTALSFGILVSQGDGFTLAKIV